MKSLAHFKAVPWVRIKFRAVEVVRVREEFRECASERRLFFPDECFQHPAALTLIRTPVPIESLYLPTEVNSVTEITSSRRRHSQTSMGCKLHRRIVPSLAGLILRLTALGCFIRVLFVFRWNVSCSGDNEALSHSSNESRFFAAL